MPRACVSRAGGTASPLRECGMSDGGGSRTLTFLFTDIEGSTRLWEQHGDAMRGSLAQHDDVVARAVWRPGAERSSRRPGTGCSPCSTSRLSRSPRPLARSGRSRRRSGATLAALRVRMAVHCGPATEREGDYYGTTLNRAARLMALASRRPDLGVRGDRAAGARRESRRRREVAGPGRAPSAGPLARRARVPDRRGGSRRATSRRSDRSTRIPRTCRRSSRASSGATKRSRH